MSAAAMANCAAGSSGVGPGVNRRVLRIIMTSPSEQFYRPNYGSVSTYNGGFKGWRGAGMELVKQIDHDMVAAMKAHDVERTATLRMAKAALKNREIEKRSALTDAEAQQVFGTMINQRKDSIEQFTKGNRPELAAKEAREIVIIEEFLPKALDEAGLRALVVESIAELANA